VSARPRLLVPEIEPQNPKSGLRRDPGPRVRPPAREFAVTGYAIWIGGYVVRRMRVAPGGFVAIALLLAALGCGTSPTEPAALAVALTPTSRPTTTPTAYAVPTLNCSINGGMSPDFPFGCQWTCPCSYTPTPTRTPIATSTFTPTPTVTAAPPTVTPAPCEPFLPCGSTPTPTPTPKAVPPGPGL
jgi:hypothetical protein